MRVVTGLACVGMVFTAYACFSSSSSSSAPTCDAREQSRRDWMTAPNALGRNNASPVKLGYVATGTCTEKLGIIALSCEPNMHDNSPYLAEALALGFTTFVCQVADGGAQTEYKLSEVIAPPKPKPRDPIDIAIEGLVKWKAKMCECTSKACVDAIHDDYKRWENDVLEPMFKDTRESDLPKDKLEKAEKLDDERKECRRRF
jgi:hypothetical protein